MWEQILAFLTTQGVLGMACVAEALVIRTLYNDLKAARDETARVLEECADSLERARGGKE
jgi:hypothetical protein